ncbi:MAG TPA: TrmH family RNA methyltransferase [Candidatus Saccharibacteria bacterium]|nr:TrmH family RNA methyltransferase [Candidatus Saccharibacteria bacterium]
MLEDTRNLVDNYKGLSEEAIVADLDRTRHTVHVAVENLTRDFNMGTIVRNANAFNVAAVHVIGRRQWNKRGAMATDKYLHVYYHASIDEFVKSMDRRPIIAVDNQPGAIDLSDAELPRDCVLVFGAEGPGLSPEMITASQKMVAIEQFGSTRSVNVGVASGIMLYEWTRRNVLTHKV